jgi:hypothetical protein
VGKPGGVCSAGRPAVAAATLGGRGGVSRGPAPVRAAGRGRRRAGVSERVRQAAPAEHDDGHDHGPPAPSPRAGGTIRESAAAAVQAAHGRSRPTPAGAVPARPGPGRLRPGPAGAAGRGGAAVGPIDCAAEGGLGGGVRDVEAPAAGRPRARVRVGGRHLRQGRAGEGQGGHARHDRGAPGWAEGRPRGGERVSRVDGELGGAAARPQGARATGTAAAHR